MTVIAIPVKVTMTVPTTKTVLDSPDVGVLVGVNPFDDDNVGRQE
jgi:hypothetical protein